MEKKENPIEKMGRKWKSMGKMPSCLDMEKQEKYTLYNIVSENGNGEEKNEKRIGINDCCFALPFDGGAAGNETGTGSDGK